MSRRFYLPGILGMVPYTENVHFVLVVGSHRLLKSTTYNNTNRGELKLKTVARQ